MTRGPVVYQILSTSTTGAVVSQDATTTVAVVHSFRLVCTTGSIVHFFSITNGCLVYHTSMIFYNVPSCQWDVINKWPYCISSIYNYLQVCQLSIPNWTTTGPLYIIFYNCASCQLISIDNWPSCWYKICAYYNCANCQ